MKSLSLAGLSSRAQTILNNIGIDSKESIRSNREQEEGALYGDHWKRWRGLGYLTMREICVYANTTLPQKPVSNPKAKVSSGIPGKRVPNQGKCEKCGTCTHWTVPMFDRVAYWCGC